MTKGLSIVTIRPKRWPKWMSSSDVKRVVKTALDAAAKEGERLLKNPTESWTHKPDFTIREFDRGYGRSVTTTHNLYRFVNNGVRRRIIRAKRARVLRFYPGSSPKTIPDSLRPRTGARGYAPAFAKFVRWPGIKARHFDRLAAKEVRPFYRDRLNDAIADLKDASGGE